ncbi:MAG: polymorphic toxin-type HINT domain-containing protein, partial [Thermoactinomyces sp.]
KEVIETTAEHPFWVAEKGWVQAKDLQPGDQLETDQGQHVKVTRIAKQEKQTTVYNYEVKDYHTYYVSGLHLLVHNMCGKKQPIWTPGVPRNPVKNAYGHYKKHVVDRKEFPEIQNAKQYVDATHEFVKNPPPGTLTKRGSYGKTLFYHEETNTFAVTDSNGVPSTMFRPSRGKKYFDSK